MSNVQTVAEEIASEIAERERNGGKKRGRSIGDLNEGETVHALNGLGAASEEARDAVGAPVVADSARDFATKARDRILALKGNSRYWEGSLSYAQRQNLNGALAILQELLGDVDNAKLPLTMGRYLGIQIPHWPKR